MVQGCKHILLYNLSYTTANLSSNNPTEHGSKMPADSFLGMYTRNVLISIQTSCYLSSTWYSNNLNRCVCFCSYACSMNLKQAQKERTLQLSSMIPMLWSDQIQNGLLKQTSGCLLEDDTYPDSTSLWSQHKLNLHSRPAMGQFMGLVSI